MKKWWKRLAVTASLASVIGIIVACSNGAGDEKVVIQTNGDEEAVDAMESALQEAGYDDQYVVQSLGTSELGGKLLAEGENIDADLVTMSSYFLESAQEEHDMFADISFDTKPLAEYPSYYTPILANTGAIFVNEEALKEKGLPMPTSLQDLTDPRFKGAISIPNIMDSSTGWLLVQSIMETYGEEEGKNMLQALVENSGPHLESSGSGPIKKVQAGETVAGFGLRHQAVKAKAEGAPIAFVDPNEGNYSLTESVAVVKKGEEKEALATEMAEVLIKDAREQLLTHYPVALYEGETVSAENKPANPKTYKESLTVELLEKHQTLFQSVQ
nr:extracellular solute-binding protein [Metabacillus iocasae]